MAVIQADFKSESLGRTVSMSAVIPADSPGAAAPYRTLYLLHGITGNHLDWLTMTRVRSLAMEHGLAVIMPAGENKFYVDDADAGDNFGRYIGEELVEFTRCLFPLSRRRRDTFIGGLSMGGYGAIRNGLKYHATFGSIAGLSSARLRAGDLIKSPEATPIHGYPKSFFRSVFGELEELPGSENDLEAAAKTLADSGAEKPRIYLACGLQDVFLEQNRAYKAHLEGLGYAPAYEEGEGGHTWEFWDTYIRRVMEWLTLE